MKMETKPPVRIHFRLSRRAGMVVALAEGASAEPASAREFTEGFCESSAPPAALEDAAGPPAAPCDAGGMGAVPETLISTGALAAMLSRMYTLKPWSCPAAVIPAPEICTVGGAAIIRRSLEYGETLCSVT